MKVIVLDAALAELEALPKAEQASITRAIDKLVVVGASLAYPHSSAVQGWEGSLRELRPRAGRGRWRAFYRRVGDELVVGAIGPEAGVDGAGFRRAVETARTRIKAYAEEQRS